MDYLTTGSTGIYGQCSSLQQVQNTMLIRISEELADIYFVRIKQHLMGILGARELEEENKLGILYRLEERGFISLGNYDFLKELLKYAGCNRLCDIIEEAEKHIQRLEERIRKKRKKDMQVNISNVPSEIQNFGPEFLELYHKALNEGKTKVYRIRLMLLGHHAAGKTRLRKALLKQHYDPEKDSETNGVEIDTDISTVSRSKCLSWNATDGKGNTRYLIADVIKKTGPQSDRSSEKDQHLAQGWDSNREKQATGSASGIDLSTHTIVAGIDRKTDEKVSDQTTSPESDPLLNMDQAGMDQARETHDALMRSSEGQDGVESDECKIQLSIWDFGGQRVYYNTHQTFLSQRAIYLMVLDASNDLEKEVYTYKRSSEGPVLDETAPQKVKDHCDYWMDSVHSFTTGEKVDENECPPVLIVGTHRDMLQEPQIEVFRSNVRTHFKGKHSHNHHIYNKKYFVVNATDENDPELNALKESILDIASKQPYWEEERPCKWLLLESQLHKQAKQKYLKLDEVLQIAGMEPMHMTDQKEVKACLVFLHALGEVIYFDEEVLKDIVILEPQWLVDAFCSFITLPRYEDRSRKTLALWDKLYDKAILDEELVNEKCEETDSALHGKKEEILHLMKKFDIISECPDRSDRGSAQYFVPCLADVAHEEANRAIPQDSLCYEAKEKFFPIYLFHRLLAACLQSYKIYKDGLYANCVHLTCKSDPNERCVFSVWKGLHSIRLEVVIDDLKPPDFKRLCISVREFIEDQLEKIARLYCPNLRTICQIYHADCKEWVELSQRKLECLWKSPRLRCSGCNGVFSVEHSLLWFEEPKKEEAESGTVLEYMPLLEKAESGTVLEYMTALEMKRYCGKSSLGRGGFGEVFKGSKKYREKEIAVEVCNKAKKEPEFRFVKERTIGYIRHPFLLPLYAVAASPEKIYLMYPYMERGDLDHVLKNAGSELEWHHRCRIIYQVCGGLQYLHPPIKREDVTIRNTVLQMDVKPSNILLDQNWNARLRLHGPAAEVTSVDHSDQIYQDPDFLSSQGKYRKEYDVFSVGVVMLKLLGAEEEFLKEFRTEDGKFQVQVEGVTKKVIIKAHEDVWPGCPEGESNCTTEFAKLALQCLKPINRISLDGLHRDIKKEILDVGDKIDTFIKPSGKLCCKCNLNNAAEDLHPRVKCSKPRKREKCAIFCQNCLTDHYRNPLYCPTHGFTQPPIGHDASFALLVGGFDEENPEIFQNDVLEFKRVLINHNIMGFRESQVYMVLCDRKKKKKATCKQKIEDRINEIKKKTAEHPEATFVFFYSGHGTKEGLNLQGDGSFQITKRELQKMFEHLNVSEKLIILDCCFAASNKVNMGKASSTQGPLDVSQINDENSQMVGKGMGESLTKVKVSGTDPDGDSAGNTASITPAELSERYLDKGHNPRDSDNFCHYEWWSCTENQISLGNRDDKLSVFTKHMVNGLRSGHKCGLQDTTDQCMWCKRLQKEALAKGYISPEILISYVFEHVKKELANYRIQQPMNTRSEKRPMKIAYYNKRHLCQEVVVFTPKETLVIKLTDQVEAKLSDIKDYIAGEVKEKGLFPSSVTGDQLCLMEEALHKEIDDDKELQQSLDRNFPLHCCLRTAQTYFKLLSGPIVLLPIDREKLMELLDHLVIETTGKEGLLFKAVKVMNRHYTITFCAEKYEGNPIKIPSQYQQDEVVKEYIGTINYAINSIHDFDQDEMRVVKSGVTFHVKIVMDKYSNTPEEFDWAEIEMVYCSYL